MHKQTITNYLATKSSHEFHPLNILIKGNFQVKTREQVAEVKRMLKKMQADGEVEFQGIDLLDSINNSGHTSSYPDGRAMPTQYHDFNSVNVSARGKREGASVEYKPMTKVPKQPVNDGVAVPSGSIAAPLPVLTSGPVAPIETPAAGSIPPPVVIETPVTAPEAPAPVEAPIELPVESPAQETIPEPVKELADAPAPITTLPAPDPLPIVEGHPLDIAPAPVAPAVVNAELVASPGDASLREMLSQELSKNGIPE